MVVRRSGILARASRWLHRPWAITLCVAVPPLIAMAVGIAVFLYALNAHEHVQASGPVQLQAWLAAEDLRAAALANGGRVPPSSEVVERLIESKRQRPPSACIGTLRYEWLDEQGTRVRIVAMGADGVPGGDYCDEDVVVWFEATDAHVSLDARELPEEWR